MEPDELEEPRPRRRIRRTAVVLVALIALLGAGAFGGYAFLRSQWYVGVDHGQVAIFRGVSGSIAGIELHHLERATELPAARLSEGDFDKVDKGIQADDRTDAERIVGVLRTGLLPLPPLVTGPPAAPTPTLTPTSPASPRPS